MKKYDKRLLLQAKKIVDKYNNYSISFLQRKLEVGYNRASLLMEVLIRENRKEKER